MMVYVILKHSHNMRWRPLIGFCGPSPQEITMLEEDFIIELMGNVPDQRVSNKYILIIMVNNGNHPQMALIQVSEIL